MIDNNLKATLLPAQLIVKGFVKGDTDCNYEKYLVELLNHSIWFRDKVNFRIFEWREKQDDGECDCYADDYGLDFKLLVSSTACHAKRELSNEITMFWKGAVGTSAPRREGTEMSIVRIHAALRPLTIDELIAIESQSHKYGTVEHDIQDIIGSISTRKNVLLFFPYDFDSSEPYNFNYMVTVIREALENDFSEIIKLRSQRCPSFETYISCVCNDFMLFFRVVDNRVVYIDCVNTTKSKIYTRLFNYIF